MKLLAEATETCYNRPELQQRASCSITPPLCSMRTAREERASQDHALPALDSNTIGGLTRGKQSRCITYLGSRKKKEKQKETGGKKQGSYQHKIKLTVAEIKKNGLRVALNLSSTPLGEYTASLKPCVALQTLQSLKQQQQHKAGNPRKLEVLWSQQLCVMYPQHAVNIPHRQGPVRSA